MITFRKIELSDVSQVRVYREAMLESRSSMDGCNGLSQHHHAERYIHLCKQNEKGFKVQPHLVPSTQFVAVNEKNEIVGMLNVRHYLNELLLNMSGHIGYSVHPNFRRQGIATFMVKEALKYCKEIGIEKVLITCLEENEASRRTILKSGGIYEDTRIIHQQKIERYWIEQ